MDRGGLELVGDDGAPLRIDRRRIRTTYISLRDRKSWFGSTRAMVDPNHTPAVEGDHYLSATTPAQRDAIETIIENSQADLLRKAQPPIVLTSEATAELAARFPAAAPSVLTSGSAAVIRVTAAVIAASIRDAWRARRAAVEGAITVLRVSGSRCGVPPVPGSSSRPRSCGPQR